MKTFSFDGGAVSHYRGTIYAPATTCAFSNGTTSDFYDIQMLCDIITATGNAQLSFSYNAGDYYSQTTGSGYVIGLGQ